MRIGVDIPIEDWLINADHFLRLHIRWYRQLRNKQMLNEAERESLKQEGRPLTDQERQEIKTMLDAWPNLPPQ